MDDPRAAGAHSAGYQEGYPSETVDYGQGGTGQAYPSETAGRPAEGRTAGARAYGEPRGPGGYVEREGRHLGLAATLLILSGLVTFFAGITGIIKGGFYTTVANYPFYYSVRSRGITELIIGAIVVLVGVCLLLGMQWARWVAIVIATISAIYNFMFLPFYPLWSIVVIAIDLFIIWECAREDPWKRRQYT